MNSVFSSLGYKTMLSAFALVLSVGIVGCGSNDSSAPDFTVSDIEGNWSVEGISFALTGNPFGDANFKGWNHMDSSGNGIGGYFESSSGLAAPLSSGSMSVKDNGEINGTVVAAEIYDIDFNSGKMDSSKDFIVWVDTSTDMGSIGLGVSVKRGGTFGTSDLEGKWYLFGPSVGTEQGSSAETLWGSFELDKNGNISDGNITTSNGLTVSSKRGAFAINESGDINGIITASDKEEDLNVSFDSGKMVLSKNIMFMTSETGNPPNSYQWISAVKSADNVNLADFEGKWYLYGVSMGSMLGKLTITGYIDVDKEGKITNGVYNSTGEQTGLQPLPAQMLSGTMHFEKGGNIVGTAIAYINTGSQEINTTVTIKNGRLSTTKDVAIMVTNDSIGEDAFLIGIKGK